LAKNSLGSLSIIAPSYGSVAIFYSFFDFL